MFLSSVEASVEQYVSLIVIHLVVIFAILSTNDKYISLNKLCIGNFLVRALFNMNHEGIAFATRVVENNFSNAVYCVLYGLSKTLYFEWYLY